MPEGWDASDPAGGEPWDPAGRLAEGDPSLGDQVTVVLTTSPCEVHPSTRLIEEVFASLARFAGIGRKCRRIVVSDGVKVHTANRYKSGQVTEEAQRVYAYYQSRLRHLCAPSSGSTLAGAELLILEKHHGFSHALRRGLMRVTTRYVLVAQHDRVFMAPAPLRESIDILDSEPDVSYLTFTTGSTVRHDSWVKQYNLGVVPRRVLARPGVELIPLIQFFDSMHVARTEWYIQRIFGEKRWVNLRVGGFIEDTLGQHMIAEIRRGGMAAHAEFGTYVIVEVGEAGRTQCVAHLSGHNRTYGTEAGRLFRHHDIHTDWDAIEGGNGSAFWTRSLAPSDSGAEGGAATRQNPPRLDGVAVEYLDGVAVEYLEGYGSHTDCLYFQANPPFPRDVVIADASGSLG